MFFFYKIALDFNQNILTVVVSTSTSQSRSTLDSQTTKSSNITVSTDISKAALALTVKKRDKNKDY
ncbi:hypothetical protein P7G31_08810 [Streptococcus parauberis]|uniref:Uncharacterized protein n=1 Tax=Streptococcus parauberis TaxID=1348 RepID=A0AAE4HXY4_9STRE|nr:hypothetical protein [Streptococcus parauberis]MDT2732324.1 hypothetical protein [Streptococcus parauberis]